MDGHRHLRPRRDEPRGHPPPAGTPATRLRRALEWLLGDRDAIDQEGLLAERTLMIGRPRSNRERTDAPGGRGPDSERDDARR
jgi:hypothetical protein